MILESAIFTKTSAEVHCGGHQRCSSSFGNLSTDPYILPMLSSAVQKKCDPVMTAYKLVTVDVPYFGWGSSVEKFVAKVGSPALFRSLGSFLWIAASSSSPSEVSLRMVHDQFSKGLQTSNGTQRLFHRENGLNSCLLLETVMWKDERSVIRAHRRLSRAQATFSTKLE